MNLIKYSEYSLIVFKRFWAIKKKNIFCRGVSDLKTYEELLSCCIKFFPLNTATTSFMILLLCLKPTWAASLEQELAQIINQHPLIKAGKTTTQSAQRAINQSRAGYFPTVSASAIAGPQYIDNPTTRLAEKDWRRTAQTASLTMTQNLFNGYLIYNDTFEKKS